MGVDHQLQENQSKNQSRRFSVVGRKVAKTFSDMDDDILENEEVASWPINPKLVILGLSVVSIPFYNEGWPDFHWVHYILFLNLLFSFCPVL